MSVVTFALTVWVLAVATVVIVNGAAALNDTLLVLGELVR